MIPTVCLIALLVAAVPNEAKDTRPMDPNYTIPVVDLAGDANRQTIVDREPGQYLGHIGV